MMESLQKEPVISIIMSVKNGAKTLDKCIESILVQSIKNWEFIICDDGSQDETFDILNRYSALDPRFLILHHDKSKGLAFSLNECISLARSNILARQDADDTSDPRRFEIQYPFVLEHPEFAIIGTCWNNINSEGVVAKRIVKEVPSAIDQVKGGIYMHPSWMMYKNQIEKVGYYTANQYTLRNQDYHLVMKVLGAGMKLCNIQECLYNYTADDNMIARTRNWKRVKGLMWIAYDSYRRNHLPIWCYIWVFKPLVVHLVPMSIMKIYYRKSLR